MFDIFRHGRKNLADIHESPENKGRDAQKSRPRHFRGTAKTHQNNDFIKNIIFAIFDTGAQDETRGKTPGEEIPRGRKHEEKPDETITVAEAARRLKVNPQTVRRAVINGKLRGVYGGLMQNRIKGVSAESVEAILKSANGGKR